MREPVGVTAHITPWNAPLSMLCRSLAPALAAGNTAVVKPAEQTPLTALSFADLVEGLDLPPGTYNVVTGIGDEAGVALAAHPGIESLTFTGSVATGRAVLRAAAEHITPVVTELGGKSPQIVFADADLDDVARQVVTGFTANSGQYCDAGSRLLVERAVHDELVERIVARLAALTLGAGIEDPDLGPMVSAAHRRRVDGVRRAGRPRGGHRGRPATGPARGRVTSSPPSVFTDVTPDMRIAREEIFGPVLAVLAFDDEEHAVELADATDYGLGVGIHTRDIDRALRIADRVDAGYVMINEYFAGSPAVPFGGTKLSGTGRERGLIALDSYLKNKTVVARVGPPTHHAHTAGRTIVTADAADVVIIGGGLEGCAAAWALTRRGITDITIVERDTVGSGGTGKSSGVVRCHYGVSSLAAMATRSLETFENAEDVLGADVGFHQTGYVVGVGPENVDALHASVADQRAVGVRTEDIDHTDVRKLWPVADLEPFAAFAWEERGGYGDAYQTAQAFAGAARRAGARLRQGTTATAIRTSGDRVTGVELADGTAIATEHVVLAAGPWSVGLLAAHGIELPITPHREQIVLVDPGQDLGPVPVFSDLVSLQYIRPEGAGTLLFGNSDLSILEPADPDRYSNQATSSFVDLTVEKVGDRLPGLANPAIAASYAGCYDVTPDFNPVISAAPLDGLVVAAGFSGHGYKISPAVGRLVADLVVDGTSSDADIPARDFRLSRFAEGDLLRSPHPYVGAGQMR